MADYDGDGIEDVVGTRYKNQEYELVGFRGHSDGRFDPEHVLVDGTYIYDPPVVQDVTGDGNPDLLLAREEGLTLYRGLGGGTFGPSSLIGPPGTYYSMLLADFNADGIPDLASSAGMSVRVMLGLGNGTFGPPLFSNASFFVQKVAAADMNRDGRLDVVAMSGDYYSSLGSVMLGAGNGTFSASPVRFWVPGYSISSIGTGDLLRGKLGGCELADANRSRRLLRFSSRRRNGR